MFKFLRKYNKMLLAIFGVLLMITFLIPQAFNEFSQRAAARTGTIATVGQGEKVSAAEWARAQEDLQILENLRGMVRPLPIGEVREPQHWYLLVREAREAGVIPAMDPRSITADNMNALLQMARSRDPNAVLRAQSHHAGIAVLLNLYLTEDLFSDRRLRAEAERLLQSATARIVVIEPDMETVDLQPTEAEIEAQMKAFADKLPGEGDMGFGYKLPDRVKIEWLKIPAASIRQVMEASEDMDAVQQRLHWKRNSGKDGLPLYPTEGAVSAIPEAVRTHLLDQLTKTRMDEIAKFVSDTLRMAQRGLPEREGYLVLPADWDSKSIALPKLAEHVRDRYEIQLPEYSARGDDWIPLDELAQLPGIGASTSDKFGSTPTSFADLVRAVKEFGGSPTIVMQRGVASPPLRDSDSSLYFFRIVDADPSREPNSIDEVREAVVRDLRRKTAYERLKSSLASLESQARTSGLLELAMAHDTTVHPATQIYLWNEFWVNAMVQYNMPMQAQPSSLPVIGADRDAIEAILAKASSLPTGTPLSDTPPADRTFAIAVDNRLAVLAFEVTGVTPLTAESFDRLAQNGAVQRLVAAEQADAEATLDKVFSFDALAKRHRFEFDRSGDATEAEGDAAEPSTAAAVLN